MMFESRYHGKLSDRTNWNKTDTFLILSVSLKETYICVCINLITLMILLGPASHAMRDE